MSAEDCACEGTGWRRVQPAYALQVAARYGEPGTQRHTAALESARNTVYPCKDHNTAVFFRWAGGHYEPDHDRGNCGECIEAGAPAARRPRRPGREEPPPPQEPPPDYGEPEPVYDFAERAAGADRD